MEEKEEEEEEEKEEEEKEEEQNKNKMTIHVKIKETYEKKKSVDDTMNKDEKIQEIKSIEGK